MPLVTVAPSDLRDALRLRLDRGGGPWATLCMPTERSWDGERQSRTRLRNLLDEVRAEASWTSVSSAEVDAILAPATELLEESSFWEGGREGAALFLAPGDPIVARLPFAPSAFAGLGRQVHVRPMWRHLEPDGTFFVLGLSAGGAALFRAARYRIEAVPLEEGPTTLDEVLQFDEHVRSVQFHTGTSPGSGKDRGRSAVFFGHEDAGDKRYVKEGLLRFLRALDKQVRDVLGNTPTETPLLLAGVEELRGLYRQVSRSPRLLDAAIETSVIDPETRTWVPEELHRRAWPLVRPYFEADRREAIDRFHTAPERTAGNPGSVLLAAAEGRVDTLFVAESAQVWGLYDEGAHAVQAHERRQPGDAELLNAAAVQTLRANGTVYVTDASDVPEGGPIAALLRY